MGLAACVRMWVGIRRIAIVVKGRIMAKEEVEFDEDLMRRVTAVAPRAAEVCVDACDGLGAPAQTDWVLEAERA